VKESLIKEKQKLRESLSDFKSWQGSSVELSNFFNFYQSKLSKPYIGLYKSLSDELSIEASSFDCSWKAAWPKIVDHEKSLMKFFESESFVPSAMGFKEPSDENAVEVFRDEIEIIFVPGLAFDYKGARLGRGKGFYDRYLKGFKGLKVGVCHWTRFLNRPIQVDYDFDVFMDYILTDKHLFKVNSAFTNVNEVL
jgi:5-formyltetrahydrofolate cyclo-ligase